MFNLRQIANALAATDTVRTEIKAMDRLKMLRDRGLIPATAGTSPGKTTLYDRADVAFAVLAFVASESGTGQNAIRVLKDELHRSGAPERQEIRSFLADIEKGEPVFVRFDVARKDFPSFTARISGINLFERPLDPHVVQSTVLPLTALVSPIFRALDEAE